VTQNATGYEMIDFVTGFLNNYASDHGCGFDCDYVGYGYGCRFYLDFSHL